MLLHLGYRVVCPDMIGYGRSDAPETPQASDLAYYSFKRAADDLKELARQLGSETIILGGHDWVSRNLLKAVSVPIQYLIQTCSVSSVN